MNIPIIDLHSHSNISDGLLTPTDLMLHAAENNGSSDCIDRSR